MPNDLLTYEVLELGDLPLFVGLPGEIGFNDLVRQLPGPASRSHQR